ncbi:MAG: hypothetical protein R3Y43_03925 [Alphaproteobacteria bacterium]
MNKTLVTLLGLSLTSCVIYVENDGTMSTQKEDVLLQEAKELPASPQDYGILASRVTNKMLDDTKDIYESIPQSKIYIRSIEKISDNIPEGFYSANKNINDILTNSNTFIVTNNQAETNYHLESIVSANDNTIVYKMNLLDNEGNIIKEYTETLSRLQNDDKTYW